MNRQPTRYDFAIPRVRVQESDDKLVAEAQIGSRSAYEELVRRTSRLVYVRLYLDVGDPHEAEDLTQETFLLAYRSLDRLKDPGQFRAWLCTIADNARIDAGRHERRQKRAAPPRSPAEAARRGARQDAVARGGGGAARRRKAAWVLTTVRLASGGLPIAGDAAVFRRGGLPDDRDAARHDERGPARHAAPRPEAASREARGPGDLRRVRPQARRASKGEGPGRRSENRIYGVRPSPLLALRAWVAHERLGRIMSEHIDQTSGDHAWAADHVASYLAAGLSAADRERMREHTSRAAPSARRRWPSSTSSTPGCATCSPTCRRRRSWRRRRCRPCGSCRRSGREGPPGGVVVADEGDAGRGVGDAARRRGGVAGSGDEVSGIGGVAPGAITTTKADAILDKFWSQTDFPKR